MTGWRRRIQEVLGRRRLDAEAADELAHHLELAVTQQVARGVNEREARRHARLTLGDPRVTRERIEEERTGFAFEQLAREARHAARVLARAPGATALSVATIALGIGVSTALFALVNAVVLRPLPYPDPDRLVRIINVNPAAGIERGGAATGNVFEWRQRVQGFQGIAGYYEMGRTMSAGDATEVVIGAHVTEDFFDVAKVPAQLGRTFTAAESADGRYSSAMAPIGANPVVVLSHATWQSRFGGDPNIVGRTVTIERVPFSIVGVMPAAFALPDASVRAWLPWHVSAASPRDQHYLGAVGRLAPGVSISEGERRLAAVAADLATAYPATNAGWSVRLLSLQRDIVGSASGVLWMLLGAVGLLLVVACANVSLLTLLRGLDRAGDAAVRLALGASSVRLLREFLIESLVLAAVGGLLGLGLAATIVAALPRVAPDLPRLGEVALDAFAFAFVSMVTTLAALVSGLPQAWRRTRLAPAAALSDVATRAVTGGRRPWPRDLMVVAQVALAVVLLVGAGLLVRSVRALGTIDQGFDPSGVLVAPVFLDGQAYKTGDHTRTYYRTLFDRLAQLPGVVAVGGATTVPTSPLGPDFERPVWPAGTSPPPSERTPAAVRIVTPGYFAALGVRMTDGRPIDDRDGPDGAKVLMVNRALARRLWPGQSAVGRQLVVDYAGTLPYQVVGVVADMRFKGPRSVPGPEVFLPHAQRSYLILNVVVKASGDPRALGPAVRGVLREIDPQKPAQSLYPMEELLGNTYSRERQTMATLLVFSVAASFLAMLSVYGVLAQRVRERRREIGVRMALGADAIGLVRWVTDAGLRLIAAGLACGLVVSWFASRALAGLLFGVQPTRSDNGPDRDRGARGGRRRRGGGALVAGHARRSGGDPAPRLTKIPSLRSSVVSGLTLTARQAGAAQAMRAVAKSRVSAAPYASGSIVPTSNNSERARSASSRAPTIPTTAPTTTGRRPCVTTITKMRRGLAPSASRTPISRARCEMEYASTP